MPRRKYTANGVSHFDGVLSCHEIGQCPTTRQGTALGPSFLIFNGFAEE